MRRLLPLLAATALLASAQLATAEARPAMTPAGVVAIVDEGINPYHQVFRDDSARGSAYPGSYLPGYPADVPALRLSLDAPSFAEAMKRDCDTWRAVKPGTLYWIPGTKIVGAISFDSTITRTCSASAPSLRVFDTGGHGTMTASRAVGAGFGACPDCRVVAVQAIHGFGIVNATVASDDAIAGLQWTARQSRWIDAESNSWGSAGTWDPTGQTGLFSASPELVRAVEHAGQSHLTFFASGNGVANTATPPARPTTVPQSTPSILLVGGVDSGHLVSWHNVPVHLAADACDNWAAEWLSMSETGDTVGGGTSAATPYVAASAVRELVEARRLLQDDGTGVHSGAVARGDRLSKGPLADGVLTMAEWRRVLLTTATRRPVAEPTDGPECGPAPMPAWSSVPDAFPEFASIGYGAVDSPARALASKVLAGKAALPDRATTDAFFSARDAATAAAYSVYSTGG